MSGWNVVSVSGAGIFNGVKAPIKQASRYFWPPHVNPGTSSNQVTFTASRYYVMPFYVERSTTFQGAWCYNQGVGDNGKNLKIAAYSEAAAGGPGALAKSFGAVALTGASALRTFASSWTAAPGWYYLEITSDSTPVMYAVQTLVNASSAGWISNTALANLLGVSTPTIGASADTQIAVGEYVGGTYANFPESTSLTPATTIFNGTGFPLFGLYT